MANIKSAKKRVLVLAKKTEMNKSTKSALKTVLKKADRAIEAGEGQVEAVRLAIKKVDQAVAKGIIKKNTAARRKSALAKKLNIAG